MDDVAKRREARRRRILENSENRLNRISGIERKSPRAFVSETRTEGTTELPSIVNCVSNETGNEVQPQQSRVRQSPQSQKQYRTTVISALAVFVNVFLLAVEKLKFDSNSSHVDKIFLPLFVYEMIEFLSLNKQRAEHKNFLYALVALSSKNKHVLTVINCLTLIADVLQDVMVYFFVFVCCDAVKHVGCTLS